MNKKVLIISTSSRKNGNSEMLADAFLNGAKDAGNSVEKISLYDKTIGHSAPEKAYEMGKGI